MTPRILILCQPIDPPAFAPRLMTLVRHLIGIGWHCEIATEDSSKALIPDICPVHILPKYQHYFIEKLFGGKERAFFHFVQKELDIYSFDLIFCASYYFFPLRAAYWLAEKYQKPLVVDLRDIAEQWGTINYHTHSFSSISFINRIAQKCYTKLNMHHRNQILRKATAVTTVSPWHQQWLAQYNSRTHLIYNGYDEHIYYPQSISSDTFQITFLGKYYPHYKTCPIPLFQAINNLLNHCLIAQDKTLINFYTTKEGMDDFYTIAKEYGMEKIVRLHGYISPKEAIEKMQESSVMLVFTTSSRPNGPYGMMGTKFYEILGIEKPCLCLVSDEGCLADAIEKTNAGLAATTTEEVEQFILEKYHEWQEKGFTRQPVKNKEQFTRQHEAQQFEELFLQCLQ